VLEPRNEGSVDAGSQIEGRVVIMKGAKIVNSRIRGPVVIGSDTVIDNSYIGPYTSVGNGCNIVHSELEHSVLLDGCTVNDVHKMTDSLLGRNVQVVKSQHRPRALRLMLGDDSKVELDA
jgi:glucose-1-phosphate thymidylyltransferase